MVIAGEILDKLRHHWATWPSTCQRRWEAWLQFRGPALNESAYPPDSPVTVVNYARNYTYAERLVHRMGRVMRGNDLARFWSPELIAAMVLRMRELGYAPTTVRAWLIAIERVLCAMDPNGDRDYLNRKIKKTPREGCVRGAPGRMQDTRAIVALGMKLMARAEIEIVQPMTAAIQFRIGFMICLLALRPYRRAVFASLEYCSAQADAQLCRSNHLTCQNGKCWIVCPSHGVNRARNELRSNRANFKTRHGLAGGKFAPLREEVPTELLPSLRKYLDIYRPTLAANSEGCTALWVSKTGAKLSSIMIFKDLVAATKREFKKSICPQLFRNCHALSELKRSRTHTSKSYLVLGHLRTMTYRRYLWTDLKLTITVGHGTDLIFDELLGDE